MSEEYDLQAIANKAMEQETINKIVGVLRHCAKIMSEMHGIKYINWTERLIDISEEMK